MLRRLRACLQPAHVRNFDPTKPQAPAERFLALEPRVLLDGAVGETAANAFDPDRSPVIDLNGPTRSGEDIAIGYPNRETSIAPNAEDAFVSDPQDDIVRLEITLGGDHIENKDAIRIGSIFFNHDRTESHLDVAIGGSLFDISYDADTKIVTIVDADDANATLDAADLSEIVRIFRYGSLDLDPREGTLTFAFTAFDAQGNTSATARAEVVIDSDGATPYIDLDPDRSSSTGDVFQATFREADGLAISVADSDARIVSNTGEPIRQVVITLLTPQEGDQMRIQVPDDIEGITANIRRTEAGEIRVTILTSSQAAGENYADLARVIRSVTFINDSEDPGPEQRVVNIQLLEGSIYGFPTRLRLQVAPQNDAPTLDLELGDVTEFGPDYATTWREDGPGVAIISVGSSDLEDVDDEVLQGARVVNANPEAGDRLYIDGGLPEGIAAVIAADGTSVDLSGEGSTGAYARALEAVRFATDPRDPTEGTRSIRVTVNDGSANSNTATALVTVEADNDAPFVVAGPLDDRQTGFDSVQLEVVDASRSFDDVDDDDLRYTLIGDVPAWLSIDARSGIITGTPPADASQAVDPSTGLSGRYEVRVRATDPGNAFAETTIVYQISNPDPIANPDVGMANDGGPRIVGNVLTGEGADSDPDGDPIFVGAVEGNVSNVGEAVPGSRGGSFTVSADGDYVFDPGTDFLRLTPGESETTGITYRVADGQGGTDIATLIVTVLGTNNAPIARDDALFANADAPISGNLMIDNGNGVDRDPDGDRLRVVALEGRTFTPGERMPLGSGASLTLRPDGSYTYDPGRAFESLPLGDTGVDTFTYTVADPFGATSQANVTFTVTGTNEAPIALDPSRPPIDQSEPDGPRTDPDDPRAPPLDDQAYIPVQTHVDGETIEPFSLAPWFGDPDAGDVLTFSVDPARLTPDLTFDPIAGTISGTFSPDASQGGRGGVYLVPITATDPHGASFTTNLTISVANPGPIAADDAFDAVTSALTTGSVFENNGFGEDLDPDGDRIRVISPNAPAPGSNGGTFVIAPDGAMTFDPGSDFSDLARGESRTTSIGYTISDGEGGEANATVVVTVMGEGHAPAVSGPAENREGTDAIAIVPFEASSFFQDADGDALTYSLADGAPDWMAIDPATGRVSGTPPNDASADGGIYRVRVVAGDGDATAELPVLWRIVNPGPTGVDDRFVVAADAPASMDLLANDMDPDRDELTVIEIGGRSMSVGDTMTLASGATLTMAGPNDLVWSPSTAMAEMDRGESFEEVFTYTLVDAQGSRSQATARAVIFGTVLVPQAPVGPAPVVPGDPQIETMPVDPPGLTIVTGDPILTETLEEIVPLSPRIDLDPSSPVPILTQALEQVEPLGGDVTLFRSPSLHAALENVEGDARWAALTGHAFEGHELTVDGLTFRTVLANDVVFLDLGSFGGSDFERWRVSADGAARLHLIDRNMVQIERPADRDHVHLDVKARAPDGRIWRVPLRVDMVHGEVRTEGRMAPIEVAPRANIGDAVRARLAPSPLAISGGDRVVDLSKPLHDGLCEVPVAGAEPGGADRG